MAEPPNWPVLTEGLGETWEIAQNSIKPYPCGFVIHPVLDCVLDWRRGHPTEAIERVVVRGHPLLSHRTDRPDVSTGSESQVSVQHAVAAALVHGEAGLDQFSDECVRDPQVIAMRRRVEVIRDVPVNHFVVIEEGKGITGKTGPSIQRRSAGGQKSLTAGIRKE